LLILSPIAFIAWILPATREWWALWWRQLIQWALIGVMASFFIFLAFHFLEATDTPENPASRYFGRVDPQALEICPDPQDRGGWQNIFNTCQQDPQADICICLSLAAQFRGGGQTGPLVELIGNLLPVAVTLVLLGLALTLGFQTGARGATAIISWGRTRGRVWGARAWQRGKRAALGVVPERIRERAREWATRELGAGIGTQPGATRAQRIWGRVVRGTARATGLTWARRRLGQALGPGLLEAAQKEIKGFEKELEELSVDMVVSKFHSTRDWLVKIAAINRLAKKGEIDEVLDRDLISNVEIEETLSWARRFGADQEIISAMPHLVYPRITAQGVAAGIPTPGQAYAAPRAQWIEGTEIGLLRRISPGRVKQISRRALEHPDIMEGIVRAWDGRQIGPLLEEHGGEAVEAIQNAVERLARIEKVSPAQWLESNNLALLSYIRSTAGRRYFHGWP
jgi:hypothetical protein